MGRPVIRAAALVLLVVGLGVPGVLCTPAALAKQHTIAPPGNSSVSQYMEDLPTARGNRPTSSITPPSGGSGRGSSLPPGVARKLDHSGSAGRAAAGLAAATGPGPAARASRRSPAAASAPTGQLLKTLGGSAGGGLGVLLPVLLIGTLVIVSAAGILRRLRGPDPERLGK